MKRKTQTELLAARNAKANAKMKRGAQETHDLLCKVRDGEMTAGDALLEKARRCEQRQKAK